MAEGTGCREMTDRQRHIHLKCVVAIGSLVLLTIRLAAAERPIPKPLPGHPGNVFVAGEAVVVSLPLPGTSGQAGGTWRLTDYESNTVAEGAAIDGKAMLGKLRVGYYELRRVVAGAPQSEGVTIGVLAPLEAPTPLTSPISIDVASAWFYSTGPPQEGAASLCALAGMNWVRDRSAWREIEPKQNEFAAHTKYDDTARRQSATGLQILQVHHDSPVWANPDSKRFPLDLRDAYHFSEETARRWKGQVSAFEPWNEADIEPFGGHTGAEMAALQKASYLGLKAGNPDATVCMNVFAGPNPATVADLNDNEAWPYFDTFNLHHYCGTDQYPAVYAAFRAVSAGRPMWVTEFNLPVKWAGDATKQEPTDADLRVQAGRVAQVYAASLFEGPAEAFYFILGHYCEGQTQFGIIHKDLSPRPAFLAVAAVGRLLADAKPLGKMKTEGTVRAFLFRARPDGRERDVLVAWTTTGEATVALPSAPVALFDLLGRPRGATGASVKVGVAPVFVIFDTDAFDTTLLEAPPKTPAFAPGKPSAIVMQAVWPRDQTVADKSAYRVSSEKVEKIPLFIYNFGSEYVVGKLAVTAPASWKIVLPVQVMLAPGERKELALGVDCREGASIPEDKLKVAGDFGPAGKSVLSVRLILK